MKHLTLTTVITTWLLFAIQTSAFFQPHNHHHHHQASSIIGRLRAEEWKGEVASNRADGRIMGCVITSISILKTYKTNNVKRNEADLAKFSQAIYKKITSDARQQRFQGFKPGTIPPHLLPTYKAYTMDEVAREATLEAMQQHDIRPFESCRSDMKIGEVGIAPRKRSSKKGGKKKKKKSKSKEGDILDIANVEEEKEPEWLVFDEMKDALKAGWEVSP
eukprot:scaffold36738_cov51-Cyclotella_meneghiniana.AAC.1